MGFSWGYELEVAMTTYSHSLTRTKKSRENYLQEASAWIKAQEKLGTKQTPAVRKQIATLSDLLIKLTETETTINAIEKRLLPAFYFSSAVTHTSNLNERAIEACADSIRRIKWEKGFWKKPGLDDLFNTVESYIDFLIIRNQKLAHQHEEQGRVMKYLNTQDQTKIAKIDKAIKDIEKSNQKIAKGNTQYQIIESGIKVIVELITQKLLPIGELETILRTLSNTIEIKLADIPNL